MICIKGERQRGRKARKILARKKWCTVETSCRVDGCPCKVRRRVKERKKESEREERWRDREGKRNGERESGCSSPRSINTHYTTTQPTPNPQPTHTLCPMAQPLDHCVALTRQRHPISSALPNHRTYICTYIYTTYIEWTILITIVLIKRPLLFLPSFKLIGSISTLR